MAPDDGIEMNTVFSWMCKSNLHYGVSFSMAQWPNGRDHTDTCLWRHWCKTRQQHLESCRPPYTFFDANQMLRKSTCMSNDEEL